ncbi:MAG: hypothetical protein ABJG33_00065 [Balneola sp.]
MNYGLQILLHFFNVIIVVFYTLFSLQCWRAYRSGEKQEHQKVFLALSLVFVVCSISGYAMHVLNWLANFDVYVDNVPDKNTTMMVVNTTLHGLLAFLAGWLVTSSATARLRNTINHLKGETKKAVKEEVDARRN